MKKWTKFVAGNQPITAQDLVAFALVGMLLGGVIVWFVFAALWGYRVFENAGSAADWAAALATGVVGWGALKYAKAERAQTEAILVNEANRIRLQRQREKRIWIMWAETLNVAQTGVKAYSNGTLPRRVSSIRGMGKALKIAWQDIGADRASQVLSAETISLIIRADLEKSQFNSNLELFFEIHTDMTKDFDPTNDEIWPYLIEISDNLSKTRERLIKALSQISDC